MATYVGLVIWPAMSAGMRGAARCCDPERKANTEAQMLLVGRGLCEGAAYIQAIPTMRHEYE